MSDVTGDTGDHLAAEAALHRELDEELGVVAEIGERVGPEVQVGDVGVLRLYLCRLVSGEPAYVDHDDHRWLSVEELDDVPWIPVDRPLVEALRAVLGSQP